MSLAETAQLVVDLQLKNGVSVGARAARSDLAGIATQAGSTEARMSGLSRVSAGAGASFSHLRMRAGQLAQGLGVVGLGGAVLGITKLLKDAVSNAEEFGRTSVRVHQLTGLSVGDASQLADAISYYGISSDKTISILGMLAKNVGNLTKSKATAAAVEKEFGFSVLDANGHVKTSSQLIADLTDYWNQKTIPTQEKVALSAKLLGRGYQDFLPILAGGRAEFDKQLAAGMRLSDQQIKDQRRLRDAQKAFNDMTQDLSTTIGLALVPELTKLTKVASEFVHSHDADIKQWFRNGLQFAKDFASFARDTVIPALRGIGDAAATFWHSVPGPLQDLLIKGIAADRTVKFLFGFSPIGAAAGAVADAVKGGIGGLLGHFFSRGASPANPLYVSGGIGGAGLAPGGSGLLGRIGGGLALLGTVAIAAMSIAALGEQIGTFMQTTAQAQADLQAKADAARSQSGATAIDNLIKLTAHLSGLQGLDRILADTFGGKQEADALANLADAIANDKTLGGADVVRAVTSLKAAQAEALARGNQKVASQIGADLAKLQARSPTAAQAATLQRTIVGGDARQSNLLQRLIAKRTDVVVNTTVNTSVSSRDVQTKENTTSRYGFVAF